MSNLNFSLFLGLTSFFWAHWRLIWKQFVFFYVLYNKYLTIQH